MGHPYLSPFPLIRILVVQIKKSTPWQCKGAATGRPISQHPDFKKLVLAMCGSKSGEANVPISKLNIDLKQGHFYSEIWILDITH